MPVPWSIKLARVLFLTLAVLLGGAIAAGFKGEVWLGMLIGLLAGGFFVLVDSLLAQFSFREFSFGVFGLLVGLFCAFLVTKIGIFDLPWFQNMEDFDAMNHVYGVTFEAPYPVRSTVEVRMPFGALVGIEVTAFRGNGLR